MRQMATIEITESVARFFDAEEPSSKDINGTLTKSVDGFNTASDVLDNAKSLKQGEGNSSATLTLQSESTLRHTLTVSRHTNVNVKTSPVTATDDYVESIELSNACRTFYFNRQREAEATKQRLAAHNKKSHKNGIDTAMDRLRAEMVEILTKLYTCILVLCFRV